MNNISSQPVCLNCWMNAKGHWEPIFTGKEIFVCQMPVRDKLPKMKTCAICSIVTWCGLLAPVTYTHQNCQGRIV